MSKRAVYLDWEDFFIGLCQLAAQRSKDPNTQVGAVIVDGHNRILGIGYNGMPRGCNDDTFPWSRPEKYLYVCHAEANAILNVNNLSLVPGSRLYTTLFPCNECAKIIVQAGITKVIYLEDKYEATAANLAAKRMFSAAGIALEKYGVPPITNVQNPTTIQHNTVALSERKRSLIKLVRCTPYAFSSLIIVYKFCKWLRLIN